MQRRKLALRAGDLRAINRLTVDTVVDRVEATHCNIGAMLVEAGARAGELDSQTD